MNTHSRLSNRRLSARFSDDRVRIPAFIIDLRCRTEECARPYRSASNERLFVTRSILLSFVRVDGRVVSHFFKLVNSLQASSFERAPFLRAPPPSHPSPPLHPPREVPFCPCATRPAGRSLYIIRERGESMRGCSHSVRCTRAERCK